MSFSLRLLTFWAIVLLVTPLHAKKTTIKGSAVQFTSQTIRVYRYNDLINLTEQRIGAGQINENGQFELVFDLQHTERLTLRIDDKAAIVYAQPGKVLNVVLTYDDVLNAKKLYDKQLSVDISFPQPEEINGLLMQFMKDYNQFIVDNEKRFVTNSALAAIKEFSAEQKKKYENTSNKAFLRILELNLAILFDAALGSKRQTFENHFKTKPIAYHDYDYMELFRQFYARRFEQLALGKNGMELLAKVNGTFDYPWLLQLMKNDIYVNQQDTLAELLLIYGLSEAYYDEELFKAEKVLAALNHIGKISPYPTHRKLAQQVVQRLTYLKPGTAAPTISVIDENGDAIEVVKSGGNKISYIQFWSSRSPSSMREMVLLNALYAKYHPTVEFVSINMDKKGTNWEQLLKNKNYEWTFGIPVDMQELKRSYQLNNYPLYLLVGKNGKIIQYPAATPTESIEKTLYDLSNKKP